MKLYDLHVTLLVEDEHEAKRAADRVLLALSDQRSVVDVGELGNITHTASSGAELPVAEVAAQQQARSLFFRNHLHRINQTLV